MTTYTAIGDELLISGIYYQGYAAGIGQYGGCPPAPTFGHPYLAGLTQSLFIIFTTLIASDPTVANLPFFVAGHKYQFDMYVRELPTYSSNYVYDYPIGAISPYYNFETPETELFADYACAYLQSGILYLGDCPPDTLFAETLFICQSEEHVPGGSLDYEPSTYSNVDSKCIWIGDKDETYTDAKTRCEAVPGGELLPLYNQTDTTELWNYSPTLDLMSHEFFMPFTIHPSVNAYNPRWPTGESFQIFYPPFDIRPNEVIYFNVEEMSKRILVWNPATTFGNFRDIATYTARALCSQPADSFECTYDIELLNGKLETTPSGGTIVCDPGYELPTGVTGVYPCGCPTRLIEDVVQCLNTEECDSDPCQNGGVCVDHINSYSCDCPPGYDGDNCEIDIPTACDGVNCMNGGTCLHDGGFESACDCPEGYSGTYCEKLPTCVDGLCKNGADCYIGDGDHYYCVCQDGWTGINCDIEKDECQSNPCLNGGECEDRINGYQCTCRTGFSGPQCQTNKDDCYPNPCINGGTCVDRSNDYTCNCRRGYSGKDCDINDNDCTGSECGFHGTCRDREDGFECDCDSGYSGTRCEYGYCGVQQPCNNGGRCIDILNGFICICKLGYTGVDCLENVCDGNRCSGRGTCTVEAGGRPTCRCVFGYTGSYCEVSTAATPPPLPPPAPVPVVPIILGTVGGVVFLVIIVIFMVAVRNRTNASVASQPQPQPQPQPFAYAPNPFAQAMNYRQPRMKYQPRPRSSGGYLSGYY